MRRSVGRILAQWALWALSLASLCVPFSDSSGAAVSTAVSVAVLPFSAVWALAAFALWLGYRALFAGEGPTLSIWLLSALLAGVTTLGRSFAQTGTTELLSAYKIQALLYFAGRVPMYGMGAALLLRALKGADGRGRPAWVYALILLACWSPYLVIVWPGTVSNDSVTQLAQLFGVQPMSNGNPIFQTWLLGAFVWLGRLIGGDDAVIALYCCVQALLMAWLLGRVLSRLRGTDWLRRASLAFYALCPVFPIFAFCVGKDTSFAMAVLWLTASVERFLDTERPAPGASAALIASAVLCALLRNAGVYLAALTLLFTLICTLRRRRALWPAPTAALGAALAVTLLLRLVLLPTLHIAPMPETEEWSVPLQQVARVAVSEPLTEEERAALAPALDPEALKSAYNGELSDPVKNLWNENATQAEKAAFFRLWLKLLAKHPATCLSATFHNTYGYLYPGYVSTIKPTLLVGEQRRTTLLDGVFRYTVNPRAESFKQTLQTLYDQPLFRLIVAPGLYGWLTLLCLFTLVARRRGKALIVLLPAAFTLAGCLFSAVNGYFRYAMPLYFCAPICLTLLARANAKEESP